MAKVPFLPTKEIICAFLIYTSNSILESHFKASPDTSYGTSQVPKGNIKGTLKVDNLRRV